MITTRTDERTTHTDEDASRPLVAGEDSVLERGREARSEKVVIPVAREELDVGRRRIEHEAGVRVRKTVQAREVVVDEALEKDEVHVERVKVGRPVDGPPDVRYEGDTMIIPVVEEVLVLERRLMLQEEIRVTRRHNVVHAPQRVVLRSEQVDVERIESGEAVATAPSATPGPATA